LPSWWQPSAACRRGRDLFLPWPPALASPLPTQRDGAWPSAASWLTRSLYQVAQGKETCRRTRAERSADTFERASATRQDSERRTKSWKQQMHCAKKTVAKVGQTSCRHAHPRRCKGAARCESRCADFGEQDSGIAQARFFLGQSKRKFPEITNQSVHGSSEKKRVASGFCRTMKSRCLGRVRC